MERFWNKVARPVGIGECWNWLAHRDCDGYGTFQLTSKRKVRAHRLSYEMTIENIPEGKVIDHLCRNPGCVNPYHMEVVTNRENILRGMGPAAQNSRKTLCKRGHPLEGDNLLITFLRMGYRACKTCHRLRIREYRRIKKALSPPRPRTFGTTTCIMCNKDFLKTTPRHMCCSKECGAKQKKIRDAKWRALHRPRKKSMLVPILSSAKIRTYGKSICTICGRDFVRHAPNAAGCSKKCKRRIRNNWRRNNHRKQKLILMEATRQ